MRIYDISQEVFGCAVYPGDPAPQRERLFDMARGAEYNLTAFSMCAHNGTHVDAPSHFYADGQAVDEIDLDRFVGFSYVAAHEGDITGADAEAILRSAREADPRAAERILIKGRATLTREGALIFAAAGAKLFGTESQTVGPTDAPHGGAQDLAGGPDGAPRRDTAGGRGPGGLSSARGAPEPGGRGRRALPGHAHTAVGDPGKAFF